MLKLKNVSKYYYSKGVIATGFSRVNIEFNIGEFVAIVGESGSGKSTLLNVITGLDSYEEGEMYIDGKETSHYSEEDFQEYRKKYVSNIFQNFNLVNSYTVYQNIELVLLLNGYKSSEVKEKVLDLINKVNLTKYKNTKVSKLSGGQKQRVAIARALAKDTPIIVCDEPTGNLDSRSAKEIIKLLSEIAHDKLVIVVTHNFKEIEELATRVVTMHDGKIVSDKLIEKSKSDDKVYENKNKEVGFLNVLKLGIRNTFNIIPKFLLIFIVFLFITCSLLTVYGSFKKSEYEESRLGNNDYFSNTDDKRIIVKKSDGSNFLDEDIEEIKKIKNVANVMKNDILLDEYIYFDSCNDEYYGFSGTFMNIDSFKGKLDYGRMPKDKHEVIVEVSDDEWLFTNMIDELINKKFYIEGNKLGNYIVLVGVRYTDIHNGYGEAVVYVDNELMAEHMKTIAVNYSKNLVTINNNKINDIGISYSNKIKDGYAYISTEMEYACKYEKCPRQELLLDVSNINYKDSKKLMISNIYNEKNVEKLLGINKDEMPYNTLYISENDYNKLYNKGSYQISVFVDKIDNIDKVSSVLEDYGYDQLQIRKTFDKSGNDLVKAIKIIKLVVIIGMVITMFFISYFVIKLVLKSRNVYFSTLRILGANYRSTKKILDVELFVNSSVAYLTYILFIYLVRSNVININFVKSASEYMRLNDYLLMYLILIVMSYLISQRFASKIFKKSAMNSYREEV